MNDKRSRFVLPVDEYKKLCEYIRQRDNYKCKVCRLRKPLHVHHIKYRSNCGPDLAENLIAVCNECHEAIHDRYCLVRPFTGDEINAEQGVNFEYIDGWQPLTHAGKVYKRNSHRRIH